MDWGRCNVNNTIWILGFISLITHDAAASKTTKIKHFKQNTITGAI